MVALLNRIFDMQCFKLPDEIITFLRALLKLEENIIGKYLFFLQEGTGYRFRIFPIFSTFHDITYHVYPEYLGKHS